MRETALARVRVAETAAQDRLAWSQGMVFSLPRELLTSGGPLAGLLDGHGGLRLPGGAGSLLSVADAGHEELRLRNALTPRLPLSSRLPFSYQLVPAPVRSLVARLMGLRLRGRQGRWADFPAWPLDLSADFLADLCGAASPFGEGPTPVLLTHDIDSPEGLAALPRFLAAEEAVGARSVNFVVPAAWTPDQGLLREVLARGHGIGVHGYDHSGRTAFAEDPALSRRLLAGARLLDALGLPPTGRGYRSPSLWRTSALLRSLCGAYAYDASIPTSGGPFPAANNGCASARPFKLGGLAEIPLSMPRDGSLLFLGHGPEEILALWKRCALSIARSGGVVVLLTHCEERFSGHSAMFEAYSRLLDFLANDGAFAWSTPGEVLARAGLDPARKGDAA